MPYKRRATGLEDVNFPTNLLSTLSLSVNFSFIVYLRRVGLKMSKILWVLAEMPTLLQSGKRTQITTEQAKLFRF
jgi:hypothetical protein